MATDEELRERWGDRFDPTVADWMVANGSDTGGIPGYLGMRFTEVGPGWTRCTIDVTADLLNPAGAAHGAVVASLVDHVLGSTVIAHVPRGTWPATIEFKLNYLAPTRVGELEARAELRSLSSRTAVVQVECTSGGRPVATALGTVAIVPPKASPGQT
jgi:uncharacterized protein (TIGR00369 family)